MSQFIDESAGVNKSQPAIFPFERIPSGNPDTLVRRAYLFLEDEAWERAFLYCDVALDQEPENALAYLGELLAELHLHAKEELVDCSQPYTDNKNYQKALRFADETLSEELQSYVKKAEEKRRNAPATTPDAMVQRAFLFLEDEDWDRAFRYCDAALDKDPYYALAYLGELLSELHLHSTEELKDCTVPFSEHKYYKRALKYADEALSEELRSYHRDPAEELKDGPQGTPETLIRRAFLFLEDENWDKTYEYCDAALMQKPDFALAYLGRLLADLRLHGIEELKACKKPYMDNHNCQQALQYGDDELTKQLVGDFVIEEGHSLQKAEEPAFTPERFPDGKWRCTCGRINYSYVSTCVCGNNKSEVLKNVPKIQAAPPDEGSWICPVCHTRNAYQVLVCGCGYRHF